MEIEDIYDACNELENDFGDKLNRKRFHRMSSPSSSDISAVTVNSTDSGNSSMHIDDKLKFRYWYDILIGICFSVLMNFE